MRAYITFFLCLIAHVSFPQATDSKAFRADETHAELMTILTNADRFIPGERILFSIQNRLSGGGYSFLSRVCYVELVNKNNQSVLRTKISLNKGIGQGHLYLPTSLATGNYTIIAYTSWLLNYPRDYIPQLAIELINPFRTIPSVLLSDSLDIYFQAEGNSLILGEPSRVSFAIDKPHKYNSKRLIGSILSPNGEEVSSFSHDLTRRYGHFNFVPSQLGIYKAVLSDENDNIYYKDFRVSRLDSLGIVAQESESDFILTWVNKTTSKKEAWVRVPGYSESSGSFFVKRDTTIRLPKSSLPAGFFSIGYSGTYIYRRLYLANKSRVINATMPSNSASHGLRKKLTVSIDTLGLKTDQLSVSIRKVYDSLYGDNYSSSCQALLTNMNLEESNDYLICNFNSPPFTDSLFHIPEPYEQLVRGTLAASAPDDQIVYLSSIGEHSVFRTGRTLGSSDFVIPVPTFFEERQFLLRGEGQGVIELTEAFLADHTFVNVNKFVQRTDWQWLQQKMIDVQIEDAYHQLKQDSTIGESSPSFFEGRTDKKFDFDAYTRFSTMSQTILENIPDLRVKERGGETSLVMPFVTNKSSPIEQALILVDGVQVNAVNFLEFDPARFSAVDFYTNQVNLGYAEYRGAALFKTFSGDASVARNLTGYHQVSISPFQQEVRYFNDPSAIAPTIPDHRSQLYWEPSLTTKDSTSFSFFSPDIDGKFEVVIQGIDKQGNQVFSKSFFRIEKPQ